MSEVELGASPKQEVETDHIAAILPSRLSQTLIGYRAKRDSLLATAVHPQPQDPSRRLRSYDAEEGGFFFVNRVLSVAE